MTGAVGEGGQSGFHQNTLYSYMKLNKYKKKKEEI